MAGETDQGAPGAPRAVVRALRYRNYRLFFFGQGISLVGTWMQMVALGWLVQRLTGSPWQVGLVGFCNRVPAAVLTPLAGVVVDRLNKHRIVIAAQALSMLQALALGVLAWTGAIEVWHIVALSLGLGIVNAIEVPARQAFFVEIIEDRADLPNAIALNSSLFHGARLIGPAVAGYLVAVAGEGPCFILNAVSYIAVLVALVLMDVRPHEPHFSESLVREFREGLQYVGARPALRDLMLLVAVLGVIGVPYPAMMPVYAAQVLKAGSRTYGWLMSAGGIGAMSAALLLARRTDITGLGRWLPRATCVLGFGCVLLGCSRWAALSIVIMPLMAGGMMTQMAAANTIVQTVCDDKLRGRVIGLHVLASMGTSPFGSLVAGAVAEHLGVPASFWIGGGITILCGLAFRLRLPALARELTGTEHAGIFGPARQERPL